MHCCCCCCAAVVLSYLFWCFVLCGSVNYRRQSQRGEEREWETKSERESERERDISNFRLSRKMIQAICNWLFCLLLLLIFFTTLTLIIQMLCEPKRGERRKNKKHAKLKLQIGEGGNATQRSAAWLGAAQRSIAVCCQLAVCFCPLLY